MILTLQTFNIQHARNFLTGKIDIPIMSDTIRRCGGEIVALNEVYGKNSMPDGSGQADAIANELGYNSMFGKAIALSKYDYGNALVSKFPILSYEVVPVSAERIYREYYEDRCLVNAVIDVNGSALRVLNIHMGLAQNEREAAVDAVLDAVGRSKEKLVLMGDFNMFPDDVLIRRLGEELHDVASLIDGDGFTFPSDKPIEKIDYIFVSDGIKALDASVPDIIASDHRTLVAHVEI